MPEGEEGVFWVSAVKQFCAECGKEMGQTDYGAWLRCCGGLGYWANVEPMDRIRVPRSGQFFLYINHDKWPKGKKIVRPQEK